MLAQIGGAEARLVARDLLRAVFAAKRARPPAALVRARPRQPARGFEQAAPLVRGEGDERARVLEQRLEHAHGTANVFG